MAVGEQMYPGEEALCVGEWMTDGQVWALNLTVGLSRAYLLN